MNEIESTRPTALIACQNQWLSQSFEMVFEQNGYAVERLSSGKRALDVARRTAYDVVVLDERLKDLDGVQVCSALRDDPLFDHSTPIIIITAQRTATQSRVGAYKAGAWEYCTQPVDLEVLFLKLETFQKARQRATRAESNVVVDVESGLFTSFGLEQVARHVSARAMRDHEPLACVALSTRQSEREISRSAMDSGEWRSFAEVANVLRVQGRKSDVIIRLGHSRLGIFAPSTDSTGARHLVARLRGALSQSSRTPVSPDDIQLRAGFCAFADFSQANISVHELLHRAELALDRIDVPGDVDTILSFDDMAGPAGFADL